MTLLCGPLALYCSRVDKNMFRSPPLRAFWSFTSKLTSISRKSDEVSDRFWQLSHIVPYTCLPWNWNQFVHQVLNGVWVWRSPTWSATRDLSEGIGCFWNSASRWDMKSLENLRWWGKLVVKWHIDRDQTYSCASCCSVVLSFKLSTSFVGLNTLSTPSCKAAKVAWSWKMGDSYTIDYVTKISEEEEY